jgi:hypothetical protein
MMQHLIDEDVEPETILASCESSSAKTIMEESYDKLQGESTFFDFTDSGPGPGS